MNISIVGAGYVGLVMGACLATQGFNVLCCDTQADRVERLKKGIIPFYEPALDDIVDNCLKRKRRLDFTSDMKKAVDHSDIIFVAVNTPTVENNMCNLGHVFDAAREIARHMSRYTVIVIKSTVPVGTGQKVKAAVKEVLDSLGRDIGFDVVSNPEFLKEGSAVSDFINPDRIVIGADNAAAAEKVAEIYKDQIQFNIPLLATNIETAEMIKYAANVFLATKISFINEIADLCELCGADVTQVARGMGLDDRIGMKNLNPGPGFGGSCFPKDTRALLGIGMEYGYVLQIARSVLEVNDMQWRRMVKKIENAAGTLENCRITMLGLSFKPDTDDIRESPSVAMIGALLDKKAIIKVYDPQAMDNMKKQFPEYHLKYCPDIYSACTDSCCIVLATDWREFCGLDFKRLSAIVAKPVFIDLRNAYDPAYVKSFGFHYEGVGRK